MTGVDKLLTMAKDTRGLHPIAISKTIFWFISYSIVLQLWVPFQEHLSPHQFKVSTLEDVKPSILALEPYLIYTLIKSWGKLT